MGLKNTSTEYGTLAKALHWLVAIGLFALIYLGLQQAEMERGDERSYIRFVHASIAAVVLMLMTVRIIWRFMNDVPAHPEGMPAWQRTVATLVHWGLYITVFVQLIAGAIMNGTGGRGIPVFGLFTIPVPVAESGDAHEWWEEVHEFAWRPIAVLITLHVLAALYNHFIAKNDVLRRMTVGVK
ncbi:MAG: cytochrome b [Gammaproteobacteria bacterium]|nr:cytochrome b [Gammaproteobacteria bacterium]